MLTALDRQWMWVTYPNYEFLTIRQNAKMTLIRPSYNEKMNTLTVTAPAPNSINERSSNFPSQLTRAKSGLKRTRKPTKQRFGTSGRRPGSTPLNLPRLSTDSSARKSGSYTRLIFMMISGHCAQTERKKC